MFEQRDRADEISGVLIHLTWTHTGLDCKSPCSPRACNALGLLQLDELLIAQHIS